MRFFVESDAHSSSSIMIIYEYHSISYDNTVANAFTRYRCTTVVQAPPVAGNIKHLREKGQHDRPRISRRKPQSGSFAIIRKAAPRFGLQYILYDSVQHLVRIMAWSTVTVQEFPSLGSSQRPSSSPITCNIKQKKARPIQGTNPQSLWLQKYSCPLSLFQLGPPLDYCFLGSL